MRTPFMEQPCVESDSMHSIRPWSRGRRNGGGGTGRAGQARPKDFRSYLVLVITGS